ncbi:carboxylesterase family protein, partial [Eubacteriales bacterium OttesenSCG-928-A19]|nr:carboxylesterase family protein [Eubacteriales bacterium OttesenSCG-928-A19]
MKNGVVQTNRGTLRGVHKQSYTVFRGIPYAEAPVGDLRFCPPQPPKSWEGVRDATRFGNRAPQKEQPDGSFYQKEFFNDEDFIPPMSEDCLYLNVWTPDARQDAPLPVALWIHGGAFAHGYGTEPEFDGAGFCARGVILVTINYRVGALGFLAHPWLSEESARGGSGNYGILDQIAALRWVRENIAAFGGDPGRITVFGQSAGGMSVQTLVSSRLTDGLLGGAILMSGGGYRDGLSRDCSLREAEAVGEEYARLLGVDSLDALREAPVEALLEASDALSARIAQSGGGLSFLPVIDGYVLEQGYADTVDAGLHHDIPYMIGSTEGDIGVTPEMLARGEKGQLYEGCMRWSLKNESLGRKPAYVYCFARRPLGDDAGAFHSSELWYVFGTLHRSWRPKEAVDWRLSREMMDYWCSFVRQGDPNGEGLPPWPGCTKENPHVRVLGDGA